jgi:heme-degrading monooxygenase HmoA
MVTELAELHIKTGTDAAFLAAVQEAVPLFQRARGCTAMRVEKRVEDEDRYLLIIDWETLDDHNLHFRDSADFQTWRGLVGGFFAEAPTVTHITPALTGF